MPLKKLSKSYGTSYAGLTASLRDMSGQPARLYGMPDDILPVPNGQITLNSQGGFGVYVDDSKLYQVVIYGSTPGVVMLTDLNIEVDSASASNGLTAAQVEAGATSVVGVTNSGTLIDGVGTPVSGGGGGGSSAWGGITGTLSAQTDLQAALDGKATAAQGTKADSAVQDIGATTAAAASKSTPVDADVLPLADSAASNALKKLSWSGIKATLKTYFDTLYQATLVSGVNIKTINGQGLQGSGDITISGEASSPPTAVATLAALRAISVTNLPNLAVVQCSGYYTQNDGGGGTFIYSPASVLADDGGSVIAPSTGSGRWLRIFERTDQFNVRHWGAKGDYNGSAGTDDSVAVAACVNYAKNNKKAGTNINWVFFPEGWYYTRIPPVNYVEVAFEGAGIGLTRIRHVNGYTEPLIYITGPSTIATGARVIATPYGGTKNLSLQAGTLTYPAIHYSEVSIDQGYDMDGTAYAGPASTLGVSGMSCFDFLNAGMRRLRFDALGKWGIDFRCSGVLPSVVDRASGHYRVNALNIGTGAFTTGASPEPIFGTPVMLFGFGATAPTAVDTGQSLQFAHQGGVYFVGVGSTAMVIVLYRTRADALAGTNAITYSATYTGSLAFCLWMANAAATTVTPAADTIAYDDGGKGFCIATTTHDSTLASAVIGTGYDNTISTANGIHCVMLWSDGALPAPLTAGTVYWPTYVDAKTIKLSTSAANALAGTFIDITDTGSGNIYLMYHHGAAAFGMGHFTLDDYTYDNSNATTMETRGGNAAGGYGVLCIDTSGVGANKGNIEVSNTRVEINKTPARDLARGMVSTSTFYARVNTNMSGTEGSNISFTLNGTAVDYSTSVAANTRDSMVISCQGNNELAVSISNLSTFGVGVAYNNQNGTAPSSIHLRGGLVRSYVPFASTRRNGTDANDGTARHMIDGVVVNRQGTALTSAYNKRGDTLYVAPGLNPVLYRAVQAQPGLCKGTAGIATSIGVTGDMSVGSNMVTFTGSLNSQVGVGTAVSVVGAGAAAASLAGIVGSINSYPASGSRTFTLVDSSGGAVNCVTGVTAAVINYADAQFSQVDGYYAVSGTLDFPSIAAQAASDQTIAAPSGVSFSASRVVQLGLPNNVPAGIIYSAFVSLSGNSITVRATNVTGASIDPPSGTFNARVMA